MTDPAELVKAFIRAYNERDAAGMRALMAPDYHCERPRGIFDGAENVVALVAAEWTDWPDARMELKGITVAGNRAFVESTWNVTDTEPKSLPGGTILPPTGNKAALGCVTIYEIGDGLLASELNFRDNLGFFRQLGYQVAMTV